MKKIIIIAALLAVCGCKKVYTLDGLTPDNITSNPTECPKIEGLFERWGSVEHNKEYTLMPDLVSLLYDSGLVNHEIYERIAYDAPVRLESKGDKLLIWVMDYEGNELYATAAKEEDETWIAQFAPVNYCAADRLLISKESFHSNAGENFTYSKYDTVLRMEDDELVMSLNFYQRYSGAILFVIPYNNTTRYAARIRFKQAQSITEDVYQE